MAVRDRKVSGSFEKRAPGLLRDILEALWKLERAVETPWRRKSSELNKNYPRTIQDRKNIVKTINTKENRHQQHFLRYKFNNLLPSRDIG